MSEYFVAGAVSLSSSPIFATLKAGPTYPIRVTRIDISSNTSSATYFIYKYTGGGSITGGTAFTPLPMREGTTPAAGATAKFNATAISGTQVQLSTGSFGTTGGSVSYTFPFDEIISAGSSSVIVVGNPFGTNLTVAIYFEELRLAWSH